jgi:hypothetical protein
MRQIEIRDVNDLDDYVKAELEPIALAADVGSAAAKIAYSKPARPGRGARGRKK